MILHIFETESIFFTLARQCFEVSGLKSDFLVLDKGENEKYNNYNNVKYLEVRKQFNQEFSLEPYRLILFHGLFKKNLKYLKKILKLNNKPKIAWVVYGAEVTNNFIIPSSFLGEKTRVIYYALLPYRIFVPLYNIIDRIINGNLSTYIGRIDYYAHFMPQEMDFVAEHTGVKKEMLWHSYTNIETYIEKDLTDKKASEDGNILIGNSASFTSNHLEVFDILKNINTEDRKIMVPLNYGNRVYGKYIAKKGKKVFKEKFVSLMSMLSKKEYHELLLSCSVMILNNYKQQAIGNIVSAAWLGIRLFLQENTSTYRYFKKNGLLVFSIQKDLSSDNINVFKSMDLEEIKHNREVLIKLFGKESFIKNMQEAYKNFII